MLLPLSKGATVPDTSVTSLRRHNFEQHIEDECMWLENTISVLKYDVEACENTSWAAYHARHQYPKQPVITPTSLLPLFQESAHTVAMIRHSIDVVRKAVQHINPGQTPVLTCDQPLFTLAKQIQWKWPDTYGEDKLLVMFGWLHIEMTALETMGDWLQRSGWTQALVQAEITTAGTADSFLRAAHVTRTRREHTKSQRLPCTYSNGVPKASIAPPIQQMMSTLEASKTGAVRENRIIRSFSTGQQSWHWSCPL